MKLLPETFLFRSYKGQSIESGCTRLTDSEAIHTAVFPILERTTQR